MPAFALNHVTARHLSVPELLELAAGLGMAGVELRNDLEGSASIGANDPAEVAALAKRRGVAIVTVAQLNAFDRWDDERAAEAERLADWAAAAGADAIMLSPTLDGSLVTQESRTAALREALLGLEPILRARGLLGSIEPTAGSGASVRSHADVTRALDGLFDGPHPFRIAYDTFQWHLAEDRSIAHDLISVVHVSGVDTAEPQPTDDQRVLPGPDDVTGAARQVQDLVDAGLTAPVSFECLSPTLAQDHTLHDDLEASMRLLGAGAEEPAQP